MLGRLRSRLAGLLSLGLLLALTLSLSYAFHRIWEAHEQARIAKLDPSGTEERLIVGAILATGATVVVAFVGWWDRRVSLRNERHRKAFELRSQAAFDMWNATIAAYRVLQRADIGKFTSSDSRSIGELFEKAERGTLLFSDGLVNRFTILWQESERIAGELLATGSEHFAEQKRTWADNVEAYAAKYDELKAILRANFED